MTWHLAIETSGREGSLALLQEDQLVCEHDLPVDRRTTASFAPSLKSLLDRLADSPTPLQFVSVSVGPGSFTGLRIGVTAAKTLCFALKADLIAVDSLAIIVEQHRLNLRKACTPTDSGPTKIAACTNAYRGQVFMRIEPVRAEIDAFDIASQIVDQNVWDNLQSSSDILFVQRQPDVGAAHSTESLVSGFTADGWPRPMAATLGRMAWKMYRSGKRDDLWSLVPRYLRKSAAEEKADAKANPQNSADTYSHGKIF